MPDVIGEAFVAIRPTGQAEFKAETTSAIKGVALEAAKIFGAVKIGQFLGSTLRDFIDEAREAEKVSGQTVAVLKSTGNAANLTAREIENLAGAQSEKVAVDDEMIQSGANLLLTFTKVRNEAGKGNDIFSQGTKIALDMSAALGQDLNASIIQIGKALNDPIAGVTALRRVGVQLTDQQKESIATFVAQGRVLDAQKVILKELRTEFGGSAAAIATDADRFQVRLKNFEEDAGKQLLPFVNAFLTGATAILDFVDSLGGLVQIAPAVAVAIGLIGLATESAFAPLLIVAGTAGILTMFAQKLGLIGGEAQDTSNNIGEFAKGIDKAGSALAAVKEFDRFNRDLDGMGKALADVNREGPAFTKSFRDTGVQLGNFLRLADESPAAAQLVIDGMTAQGRETGTYERLLGRSITTQKNSTAAAAEAAAQNRALLATVEDLNDAVLKGSGTQAGYDQAVLDVKDAQDTLTGANLEATTAQKEYDDAVRDHGTASNEAKEAALQNFAAQDQVKSATIGVTRAQLDAIGAAQALDDATEILNDTIGGSPEKIQAEIDKLQEAKRLHPEVAASYDPIIARLQDMKTKIDNLPKEVPINIRLEGVEVTQAQLAAIQGQINTLIGSGGQGIPVPGAYSGSYGYTPSPRYGPDGEYLGTFSSGVQRVPGPPGKTWIAQVHAGEEIVEAGAASGGGDHYEINFFDHRGGTTEAAGQFVQRLRIAQALR